jgi:MYXO-CTERM domain-containing protein
VTRCAAAAWIFLTLVPIADVRAAPTRVRLSFAGKDPATAIGISWNTISGQGEVTVEYGTSPGSYPAKAQGAVNPISATLGAQSEVELTGLVPNTTYYYRVGGPAGGFSSEQSFQTAPPTHPSCGGFKFVATGDSRAESWEGDKGASTVWPTIATLAASHKPALILHSGDIVYDGGANEKQWANHLEVTAPVSARIPILYALGNHDNGPSEGEGAYFNRLVSFPRAEKALGGSGTEDHYFVRLGHAVFVVLSTESFSGGSIPFKNQADWLDQVLSKNPARWRFVVLHKPIYTGYLFINHKPNESGQNAALVPVFNKHHVDVVFQGHNHFYERWVPSACQNGASDDPCPAGSFEKGTVYITTGGGGAFPVVFAGGTSATRVAASGKHHLLLVELKDGTLTGKAIDDTGGTLDSFTIAKPPLAPPDPCSAPTKDAGPQDGAPRDRQAGGEAPPASVDSTPRDLAPRVDASAAGDAAQPSDGCSCRIGGAPPALRILMVALLGGIGLARRRRR